MINDLARRLRNGFESRNLIPALIGRVNDDGTVTVRVPNTSNQVYVRLNDSASQTVIAFNISITPYPNAQVWVERTPEGEYAVLRVRERAGTEQYGEAATTVNLPEVVGDVLRMVLPGRNFKPGRVREDSSGTLTAYVEPFIYGGKQLGGKAIDLSSAVGSITTNNRAWIVISANTTNNLTATTGDDLSSILPPSVDDALAVDVPDGDIRLWAYNMASGASDLPTDLNYIADLRTHVTTGPSSRIIFAATDDATVEDTTTETTIIPTGVGSTTIPANWFGVGDTLRVVLRGSLGDTGTPTLNIKALLGSTEIIATGAQALNAGVSDVGFDFLIYITCRTTGTSGTVVGSGNFVYDSGTALDAVNTSAVTVDTTADLTLDVTATWGTANVSNTITCQIATIEYLKVTP